MDWFALNSDHWDRDTMHLDPFQDGVYFRLVRHYMKTRAPLPDNDHALARIVGVSVDEWMDKAAQAVRPFFQAKDGKLTHKRCDAELNAQDAMSRKRIKNAKNAAKKRWENKEANQDDTCDPHAPSMLDAMPKHATRHDTTRQDKTGDDLSSPSSSSNSINTSSQASDGDGSFKKLGGGVERIVQRVAPSGPFDIMRLIGPDAMRKAKENAPGWDLDELGRRYSENVRKGLLQPPNSPEGAFIAWCKKYTKGKPPR